MTAIAYAQNNNVDELVVKRVADYILQHGELSFKDINNGRVYKFTDKIPEGTLEEFL